MSVRGLWVSCLFLLSALAPALAAAVETTEVVHRTPDAFGKGELDHIAVTEDGQLTLSPAYRKVADLPDPIVWKTVADARGNLYLATGNDGRVYRLAAGASKADVVADFTELQVLALAMGRNGELYAATSPDGRIYRIPPTGAAVELVDLEPKYIWDMAVDSNGDLLVATGAPGGVVRVTSSKEIKPVLKTEETHILALALDGQRHLYAGSADNGYVYRLNLSRPDEAPFVMLDAPGDEVKQLLVTPDNAVVALTLGGLEGDDKDEYELSGLLARATDSSKDKGPDRETRVYRLASNRAPEQLLYAQGLTAHSLGWYRGQLLLGIGEEGKIVAIGPDKKTSFLADCSGEQVTAFGAGPDNALFIGVSNPAAVFRMEDRWVEQGVYTSDVIDSGLFAHWGRIDLRQELPAAGTVTVQTRSGNTDKPNATWSDWTDLKEGVASPSSRYLQYRLTLKARDKAAPRVREVDVYFLPVNSAPTFGELVVLDPGVRVDRKEDFRTDPEPKGINQPLQPRPKVMLKEKAEAETQGARWDASDPDGDELSYTVDLREAGGTTWRRLATDQDDEFINFNATALPDGWYQLRVKVHDALSNRPDDVLEDERLSAPFPVDHTPPLLTQASAKLNGRKAMVSVAAKDATTYLDAGRYSVDGGDFQPLFPDDQVYDELEETFHFTTPELSPGEHIIVVTLEDGVENVATGKLPVTVK